MVARPQAAAKFWIVGVLLLCTFLASGTSTAANPGLMPTAPLNAFHLSFAGFPHGQATGFGVDTWHAINWTLGDGCLRLACTGASLEIAVYLSAGASAGRLIIEHRSYLAEGCPCGGFAPVTITVNGAPIAEQFAPPAGAGDDGYTLDGWEVISWLVPGRNVIRIEVAGSCSPYELRSIGLETSATTSIEACQMTRGIAGDRPIDDVVAFASTDAIAACWVQAAPEAIGRRIEYRFFDPAGDVYFETTRTVDRFNWGYIRIAGWNAASRLGRWHVDVYVAGEFQVRLSFTIGPTDSGHDPEILGIDFPAQISSNGERVYGWVQFDDPDGDIAWITFETIDGLFADFAFDPDVAAQTNGRFSFYVYTYLVQSVTLKVTLHDHDGHASFPYYLTFHAR